MTFSGVSGGRHWRISVTAAAVPDGAARHTAIFNRTTAKAPYSCVCGGTGPGHPAGSGGTREPRAGQFAVARSPMRTSVAAVPYTTALSYLAMSQSDRIYQPLMSPAALAARG